MPITSNEISVEVNGQIYTLPAGSTLGDTLKVSGAPYIAGAAVGILKKAAEKRTEEITEYAINTPRGELIIEIKDPESSSGKLWAEHYKEYEGKNIHWESPEALAFGPFEADIKPSREKGSFEAFDVLFGAGGFDPHNTHLILSRKKHTAEYGSPEDGAFATIVTGRKIISKLSREDSILSIEPVIEWEQIAEKKCTTDLSTLLEDEDSVFTYFEVELSRNAPVGAEHFYSLTREGTLKVDVVTSSFISDDSLREVSVPYENFEQRREGAISVRTVGYGTGRTYISREERPSSLVHSVVGQVTKGLELIKLAEKGQKLSIESLPPQIVLLGHGFEEVEPVLSSIGIELIRDGYTGEDAVIVRQDPPTTLEILGEAKVTAYAVSREKLVEVELYSERAPKSVDFFRHSLGLKTKTVGKLPVYMIYDDTYLFKTEEEVVKYKEVLPENTPADRVLAGEIGVTNQAAKRMGTIGVRLVNDDLFGPTGEKFSSTNIIGRIIEPERLRGIKEGDAIYISEAAHRKAYNQKTENHDE
ncbi:methyl-coenzyme M reductase-associated protein Mmp3 [Methanosarcina horonobensis]|uniref:methyl-coenzyme M reductase-associated protein Mmp3 n=1 Tax=Methanosarcina horonobensis TaxID=418008 RepID=UPI00064ECF1F|nr:methanogenesis marker 3 protein [Methanosarcina horonobensis]